MRSIWYAAPMEGYVPCNGARQGGDRQDRPSRASGVYAFTSVKLPTQVGGQQFGNSETCQLPNFPGMGRLPEMVLDVIP